MLWIRNILFVVLLSASFQGDGAIKVGVDLLFEKDAFHQLLNGKKIGLITNHTAVNKDLQTTLELLKNHSQSFEVAAIFTPEHGFYGDGYAYETIDDGVVDGIPCYGLHGKRRRPTEEMLSSIDLLIYDIQDIGSRAYTFVATLFYCMEAAAKSHLPMLVLDRPNPMGGNIVDGPSVEEKWRSVMGYIAIPYCYGMTIGELASFFNSEYQIGCELTVIPMEGWKRGMTFQDTGLPWVPTSPQIPEADTPFFYSTTGLIGHCSLTSIGIGYTLPFKLIGSPWIEAQKLSIALNQQNLPGVLFQPFYFRPFFGKFKGQNCQGVRIVITDPDTFLPVTTQFTLLGVLKNLYPAQFGEMLHALQSSRNKVDVFKKLTGSEEVLEIIANEKYVIWKLRELCARVRKEFLPIREKYLIKSYS